MAGEQIIAQEGDSLWRIATRCLEGGGADWAKLGILRNGVAYNGLAAQNLGLKAGDTVILPEESEHSCQAEVGEVNETLFGASKAASQNAQSAESASEASPASEPTPIKTCSTKVVFVLDPGHGGRAAKTSLVNPNTLEKFKEELKEKYTNKEEDSFEEISYNDEFERSFSITGSKKGASSFNNALGAISNILEKSMTHKIIKMIKEKIDIKKSDIIPFYKYISEIEVVLTKTDEYINLSGKDRALVAKDKKADFFFCVHFNSSASIAHVLLDITNISNIVDKDHSVDINKNNSNNLGGIYPKSAKSSSSAPRGALILYRQDTPKDILSKSKIIGKSIQLGINNLITSIESTNFSKEDFLKSNTSNTSPINLGTLDPKNKKIIPIYLEADYINTESGDRLWNTHDYNSNIVEAYKRWGIPQKPIDIKELNEWKKKYTLKEIQDLPEDHNMYDLVSELISIKLLENINHRLC